MDPLLCATLRGWKNSSTRVLNYQKCKQQTNSKNTDREQKLYDAVSSSKTAEEASSKTAAYFELETNKMGLGAVITRREDDVAECKKNIRAAIKQAERGEPIRFKR